MFSKLLVHLESKINKSKNNYSSKRNSSFINKFNLIDENLTKFSLCEYNGYQGTPILLSETLVKSRVIKQDDKILDVGCGCGIFLCYLLACGFTSIGGVEFDEDLFDKAKKNIDSVITKAKIDYTPNIYCVDFFNFDKIDDFDVFYIFNSFNSEELYLRFINKIKESVDRKPRHIKIIFLYLTIYSKKALLKTDWLKRTNTIVDKRLVCYQCINYTVYENK